MKEKQIIKIGSDVTVNDDGEVNIELVRDLAFQIKQFEEEYDTFTAFVFSGYVKAGKALLGDTRKTKDIPYNELEEIIKIGRVKVLEGLSEAFDRIYFTKEKLLTYDDLYLNQEHHLGVQGTIQAEYFDHWNKGIMLPTNYHDIKDMFSESKKDNDKLAAYLAVTFNADRLIILGNEQEGLLEDVNDRDSLIRTIERIEQRHYDYCKGNSINGTGGCYSKIEAGDIVNMHGIDMFIGNARHRLIDIINNTQGSYFKGRDFVFDESIAYRN